MKIPIYVEDNLRSGLGLDTSVTTDLYVRPDKITAFWVDPDSEEITIYVAGSGSFVAPYSEYLAKELYRRIIEK